MSLMDVTNTKRIETKKDANKWENELGNCEECTACTELILVIERGLIEVVQENRVLEEKEKELIKIYQDYLKVEDELDKSIGRIN